MKHKSILLILLLALVLRVIKLGQFPPGLTWDEAAIGYNAYSILHTARDEHGAFLPLVFKSFGDYKPGLYIYLVVPFVAIFGLNEFATRLPSALLGVLSVYLLYLIVKKFQPKMAIWAALALAIQPFSLIYSRGAWETNLATTLYLSAIYFFQTFLNGGSLYPAALTAGASLLAYQGAKLVLPLLLISQSLIFKDQIITRLTSTKNKTKFIFPVLLGLALALSVYLPAVFGTSGGRLSAKSYFSHIPSADYLANLHRLDPSPLVFNLFHHLRLDQLRSIAYRYFNHLSPRLLFYEGDWQTHFAQIPNMGLLFGIDALFITLGLFYLARQSSSALNKLWFSLLVIAPLPAALTLDEVSSIRAHLITIPLSILSGAGLYFLYSNKKTFFRILSILVIPVFLLHFILALDGYVIHLPKVNYRYWLYGYKQAFEELKKYPNTPVVFTSRLGQPYIFYLFYSQYDPAKFQQSEHLIQTGPDVGYVPNLDQIEFHSFSFLYDQNRPGTIYVALPEDLDTSSVPAGKGKLLREIKSPDGNILYRLIQTP